MYDRKGYQRRKKGRVKKLLEGVEQYRAFDTIRNKWDFDDRTIMKLLQTHTVTEILEGEITEKGFLPKENFLKGIAYAIIIGLILFPIYRAYSSNMTNMIVAMIQP